MVTARAGLGLGVLLALGFAASPAIGAETEKMQLGLSESLFQGVHPTVAKLGAAPFLKMMKNQTGIEGNINYLPNAMELAERIDSGSIKVGIFQGHEFAYVREKYPDLIPIAVACPMQPNQSFCVVLWNCEAKNIGELKQGKLSLPPVHRDYCEMFLARQKREHMPNASFSGLLTSDSGVDAIRDVINAKSICTVVDCSTIRFFEKVYPGQFQNVKILCQSEPFPNGCVVIKKGGIDQKTVDTFRKALENAPSDPVGGPMLQSWKLKGFDKVPADYDLQLKNVIKNYPMPASLRISNK